MIKHSYVRTYFWHCSLLGLSIAPAIDLYSARIRTQAPLKYTDLRKLEADTKQSVSQELNTLKKAFGRPKGFDCLKKSLIELDYIHIFGMNFEFQNNKITMKGFHHDHQNKIEKTGIIHYSIKRKNKHGYYRAALLYHGKHLGTKNFFPAHWTRAKVVSKIREAYNNGLKQSSKIKKRSDGTFEIVGTTQEGISIRMFVNKQGTIFTAYPSKI